MSELIVLQPSFLLFSRFLAGIEDPTDYIGAITNLARVASEDTILKVCIVSNCVAALYESGLFPVRDSFNTLLEQTDLGEIFSAGDLARLYNGLLDSCLELEEALGIDDVELTSFTVLPRPSIDETSSNKELVKAEEKTLLLCLATLNEKLAHKRIPILYSSTNITEFQVSGSLLAVLEGREEVIELELSGLVPAISIGSSFVGRLDSKFIWQNAAGIADLYLAIGCLAYQTCAASDSPKSWEQICTFTIGAGFSRSLEKSRAFGNASHSGVALDACGKIVSGQFKSNMSPFRNGKHQSSGTRERTIDGAEAYRVHITSSHEALRLMLWMKVDKTFELANIGPKSELKIDDCMQGRYSFHKGWH